MKRKSSKNTVVEDDTSDSHENISSSLIEPPIKRQKIFNAEEFIKALKSPGASEALKQWLHLISSKKENVDANEAVNDADKDDFNTQNGEDQNEGEEDTSGPVQKSDKEMDEEREEKSGADGSHLTDEGEEESDSDTEEETDSESEETSGSDADEAGEQSKGENEDKSDVDVGEKKFFSAEEEAEKVVNKEGVMEVEENAEDDDKEGSMKIIDAFLHAGGSASDIVYTLPLPEDAKTLQIRIVFKVLTKVLLRISAEHQGKVQETLEVCRDLLNTYSKFIKKVFTNKHNHDKATILELLTAMVALDARFGAEILGLGFLEKDVVIDLTMPRLLFKVRVAYLKFLIALMIEEDNYLIFSVLQKPWYFTSIWDDIKFDPAEIVALLLMTVKKAILENKSVSKSSKQAIFSSNAIISLLNLYKWKGPQNRAVSIWDERDQAKKPKILVEVDSRDAELVASAVHELLKVLLADFRHGIIYRDARISDEQHRKHSDQRHNTIVSQVLQRIGHPWENVKVAELVSKVLAVCPDSMHSVMATVAPFMEPRSSPKWFTCAKFLKQVIEDQCPEDVLKRQLSSLRTAELAKAAMTICIPQSILRALNSNNSAAFYADDITVGTCTIDIIVCMLRKIHTLTRAVWGWAKEGLIHYAQAQSYKNFITTSLKERLPNLDAVQKSWQMWSEKHINGLSETADSLSELSGEPIHMLSGLIELMQLYNKLDRSFLEPLLSPQSELKLSMTKLVLKTVVSKDTAQLRNNVYKLLLDIKDESFTLENEGIHEGVRLIFRDLLSSCVAVKRLAWSVLVSLLKQVNGLEGSPEEAVLWLSIFKETYNDKEESCGDMISILVQSLARFNESSLKYLDLIAHSEEDAAGSLYENNASFIVSFGEGILEKLYEDSSADQTVEQFSSFVPQLHVPTLGPWLPAFLESLLEHIHEKKLKRRSKQAAEEFCCKLILHLLWRLPYPGSLASLLNSNVGAVPPKLMEYYREWLPGGNPQPLESGVLGENRELKLSLFLFDEEDNDMDFSDNIEKIFKDLVFPNTDDTLSECEKSEVKTQVTNVVYFVCFHLTQLAQLQKLTGKHLKKSQDILLFVCDFASQFDNCAEGEGDKLLCHCLKIVFSHPIMYHNFNPLPTKKSKCSKLLTKLMIVLIKTASTHPPLEVYLEPFKNKLLMALRTSLGNNVPNPNADVVSLVDAFPLSFQDVSELLVLVSQRPSSHIAVEEELSQWCYLSAHLLNRASVCRIKGSTEKTDVMILPSSVVSLVAGWMQDLLPEGKCNLTPLISAFMSYIESCPQQTNQIPKALLSHLLDTEQNSTAYCKLAEWLAFQTRRKKKGQLPSDLDKDEHLPSAFAVLRGKIGIPMPEKDLKKQFLPLYDVIRSKILHTEAVTNLDGHPDWLAPNINEVVYLMKLFMTSEERKVLSKALQKKAPALTQDKLYYMQLVIEILSVRPHQLLMVLLAWLALSLKKHGSSSDQATLVTSLCESISKFMKGEPDDDFSNIKDSNVWQETLRLSLKFGLSISGSTKNSEEDSGTPERSMSCLLLHTLSLVFKKVYSPDEEHEHIAMAHSMIVQHSEFLNIMMSSSSLKLELVQLLYILLERNLKIMKSSDAPVLLSAYNATLAKTDRFLLRILVLYEQTRIDLSQYRPFFWGYRGADHYSVWSLSSKNVSLQQQPRPDHVLALLDIDTVLKTVENFPIHSTLKVAENEIIQSDGVYDPSFYLPLFIHLWSPESPVNPFMILRSGALALTFASLSSFDVAVRAAAYTALTRFVSHLQMTWGQSKKLLLHFMNAVQKGASAYSGQTPRFPSIVSVFLARLSLVINNPLHPLCTPLTEYILAKPSMNLNTVPNIFSLLHSNDVSFLEHRHWILRVLCDGLRTPIDIKLCVEKVPVVKFLLSFYSSCLCDSESQLLILRFLRSAAGVQYGACCLVRSYGLTSWLHQTILNLNVEDSKSITEIVRILRCLWTSLSLPPLTEEDPEAGCVNVRVNQPSRKMLNLLLTLRFKLNAQVEEDVLNEYITCFNDVMRNLPPEDTLKVTEDILVSLIDLSSCYCPNKREFLDLLDLACDYVDTPEFTTSSATALRKSMRLLIIQWIKSKSSS